MKGIRRVAVVFVLGVILGAGITVYSSVFAGDEKESAASALPLEDLRAFSEVFGRVKSDYVETVEDKQLLESAIKGMLSGLFPPSRLPPPARIHYGHTGSGMNLHDR